MPVDSALLELLDELAKNRRLDFRGYKSTSLERRLRKRMAELKIANYKDYLDYIRHDGSEITPLLQVVLINVTEFFRDPQAWESLRTQALPLLLGGLKPGDTFRAWCAGCASGEEVYSLAILLAEHFGPRLHEYDIKIYASDHDEDALNIARRGEYPKERLQRVNPEWREKYFTKNASLLRVQRDLRRLAIFGRSNLVNDAPISHVNMLICRNVLIYFDAPLQHQILEKFHYALEGGGVLFLGKSESQLRDFSSFRPISPKWRIFQCIKQGGGNVSRGEARSNEESRQIESARMLQRSLLETVKSGIILLGPTGVIQSINQAAMLTWDVAEDRLLGSSILQSPLVHVCPELGEWFQMEENKRELVRFTCMLTVKGEQRTFEVTARPVASSDGGRLGSVIYSEDITGPEKLRNTVEELESTAEELHSTNEELETTNEELQSANEELETTNEELQSTNEELETTNEELQSLNEELETTNDELEQRTNDLQEVTTRYAETLALMPSPIAVVNDSSEIQLWNSAAEQLFHLDARGLQGLKLKQLPLPSRMRTALIRRHEGALRTQQTSILRGFKVKLEGFSGSLDIRFTPISSNAGRGVLIVFDPRRSTRPPEPARKQPDRKVAKKKVAKKSAAKKKPSTSRKSAGARKPTRAKKRK